MKSNVEAMYEHNTTALLLVETAALALVIQPNAKKTHPLIASSCRQRSCAPAA